MYSVIVRASGIGCAVCATSSLGIRALEVDKTFVIDAGGKYWDKRIRNYGDTFWCVLCQVLLETPVLVAIKNLKTTVRSSALRR